MKLFRTAYALFIIELFLLSCSFNSPTVSIPKIQRIYSKSSEGIFSEYLAVFVIFDDADGRNDYHELRLIENRTGLTWTLHRENTVFLQEVSHAEQQQWIGSRIFAYPRRPFPAGEYTVQVYDLSGNRTEQSFSLEQAAPVTTEPFTFSIDDTKWHVSIHDAAQCSTLSLIALGSDLQPLAIQKLTTAGNSEKTGTLAAIKTLSSDARYVQCLGENSNRTQGFLTQAMKLP